jgi:hypothetical protein
VPLTEGRVYRWTVADADDDLTANAARALARLLDESGLHRRGANVAQHYPSHVASDTANVVEELLSLTPGAIAALSPEDRARLLRLLANLKVVAANLTRAANHALDLADGAR